MPEQRAEFDIGHPAPARGKVSIWLVWFGFLGAPLAWSVQLAANASIAGLACLNARGAATPAFAPEATGAVIVTINLAAAALAALAFAISLGNLRASRDEEHERSGGVMQAGEGRTRFLSVWGVWTSALFLIATAANTISVLWRGLCPM